MSEKKYKTQTYSVHLEDIETLNTILTELKKLSKRPISKSELFRGAIGLLREKSPKEIKTLLDSL